VRTLRSSNAWFATGSQAVDWFRARRRVRFERIGEGCDSRAGVVYEGAPIDPPLTLRHYEGASVEDVAWDGTRSIEFSSPLPIAS
jgi:hypothetical protein